jgi:hypothetical protein
MYNILSNLRSFSNIAFSFVSSILSKERVHVKSAGKVCEKLHVDLTMNQSDWIGLMLLLDATGN